MTINAFRDEYFFLSNFYDSPITWQGINYPTVEHAFQAAKTTDIEERKRIAALPTPGAAKAAGRQVELREDWELIKLAVMNTCLILKFTQSPFKELLIATGDAELVEGNWWNDTYWGVYNGVGQNNLGKLLMKIRSDLIKDFAK